MIGGDLAHSLRDSAPLWSFPYTSRSITTRALGEWHYRDSVIPLALRMGKVIALEVRWQRQSAFRDKSVM